MLFCIHVVSLVSLAKQDAAISVGRCGGFSIRISKTVSRAANIVGTRHGCAAVSCRDKGGAVFGGIAHSPWKKTGEFYGDHASCVFSLLPAAQLYPASGINANLQVSRQPQSRFLAQHHAFLANFWLQHHLAPIIAE
jgi:hypothetical protein